MKDKVIVVGQGYVGLPVALRCAEEGFQVVGIDSDQKLVETLNAGLSTIEDVINEDLQKHIELGNYFATDDFSQVLTADIVIVCVPTPLTEFNEPDLSFVISAILSVAQYIKEGTLFVLESTVAPGTTRNIVVPIFKEMFGELEGKIYVAFSPERADPTNKLWNLKNTPKLIAGVNAESFAKASEFYLKLVNEVVPCETLEVAETAKLLENAFRLINISFINEISIFCQKLEIDVNEVIKAASSKPYGFMPFYPSVGVGGHCIPVDPIYLANAAKILGVPSRFIDLAEQINQEMPIYFVDRAEEKLDGLKNKKILVVGVAYKPNVADIRESPAKLLIAGLEQKGAQVSWHDDLVKEWNGKNSVALSNDFDLAILATPHDYLDLTKLGDVPILNTRGSI